MAKRLPVAAVLIAGAFALFTVAFAAPKDYLFVQGRVYCDPCRVMFETKISKNIAGAKVQLACRDPVNDTVSYSLEATTDQTGKYLLAVEGDHEDEICEIKVVKSGDSECSEIMDGVPGDRPVLTNNVGVVEPVRFANPLGFMTKTISPDCVKALREVGYIPTDVLYN